MLACLEMERKVCPTTTTSYTKEVKLLLLLYSVAKVNTLASFTAFVQIWD